MNELELKDDRSYEVEKLLRWRWRGPRGHRYKELLVLWSGYSIDDASCIPMRNFDCSEEMKKMIDQDQSTEDSTVI